MAAYVHRRARRGKESGVEDFLSRGLQHATTNEEASAGGEGGGIDASRSWARRDQAE